MNSGEKLSELRRWEHQLEEAQKRYRLAVEGKPEKPEILPGGVNVYSAEDRPKKLLKEINYIEIAIEQLKRNIASEQKTSPPSEEKGQIKLCPECGKYFKIEHGNQIYCKEKKCVKKRKSVYMKKYREQREDKG